MARGELPFDGDDVEAVARVLVGHYFGTGKLPHPPVQQADRRVAKAVLATLAGERRWCRREPVAAAIEARAREITAGFPDHAAGLVDAARLVREHGRR